MKNLSRYLDAIGAPQILVVGDMMLDTYVRGEAGRISPEGPIPVLRVTAEETRPGGAGNVAVALAHLGARVSACGVIGEDANGADLDEQIRRTCRSTHWLLTVKDRPTTTKTRYFGYVQSAHRGVQHMLRVDRESLEPMPAPVQEMLLRHIEQIMPAQDAVVLSDYNKGLLTEHVLERTIACARANAIPVITDPKIGRPYTAYKGSTLLTPNRYETQLATGIAPHDNAARRDAAKKLIDMAALDHVVITLDRDGIFLAGKTEPGLLIPARPRDAVDVTGAGDIVVSLLALAIGSKVPIRESTMLANIAAGIAVSRIGAVPVSRDEIMAALADSGVDAKFKSLEQAAAMAEEVRRSNGKVVWTNGCFDLFHIGHYEYLKFARRQGNLLIVGLNSDASARRVKGPNRPITDEAQRARVLAALDVVDAVVVFDDDVPTKLITAIRPDVLVKGADYTIEQVVGHELMASWGGRVVLAPVVEGFSTTDIVKRILDLHGNDETVP